MVSRRRQVAIITAGSLNAGFLSGIAALSKALQTLSWRRWEPQFHAFLGGERDISPLASWYSHLREVRLTITSQGDFDRKGILAQADASFEATPQAEVVMWLDADTFPVADFEQVLDRVADANLVAGAIAHFALPVNGKRDSAAFWKLVSTDVVSKPLRLCFEHSLVPKDAPDAERLCPFSPNCGVVFFPRDGFRKILNLYHSIQAKVAERLADLSYFAGQTALALAIAEAGVGVWNMPLRYNYPNDPLAEKLHPGELQEVSIFHYLRTELYNRRSIFADAKSYRKFLAAPLTGVHEQFQSHVRRILGDDYPFGSPGLIAAALSVEPRIAAERDGLQKSIVSSRISAAWRKTQRMHTKMIQSLRRG